MKRKSEGVDIYTEYYLSQAGSGFGNIYSAPVYQKGCGIGSFLGGLFRSVFPLLKRGVSAVGSELLKSGSNMIRDIVNSQDPQISLKKRGKESINNLSNMLGDQMFGSGYKSRSNAKYPQKRLRRQPVKKRKAEPKTKVNKKKKTNSTKKTIPTKKKKPQRNKNDIFDIFS